MSDEEEPKPRWEIGENLTWVLLALLSSVTFIVLALTGAFDK